jgi:hypothetical protein
MVKKNQTRKGISTAVKLSEVLGYTGDTTSPISLRIPTPMIQDIESVAESCGYSANMFMALALKGVLDMVNTPPGKPVMEPGVVSVMRVMRHNEGRRIVTAKKA